MELVGIREDVLDELVHSDCVIRALFSGRRRQLVAEFIENTVKQGSTICADQTDSVLLAKLVCPRFMQQQVSSGRALHSQAQSATEKLSEGWKNGGLR
jgi:hypothetical protein